MLSSLLLQPIRVALSQDKEFFRALKSILGFWPGNYAYYKKAFIHKSASIRISNGSLINNERLEYLGDAVLDAVIADYLFRKFPDKDEGFLSKMRSKIVNRDFLSEISTKIGINKLVVIYSNQGIPNKKYIYGDALEAFIGAVYVDKGYNTTKQFIIKKIMLQYIDLEELIDTETNYKSILIEWSQKTKTEIEFETNEANDPNSRASLFISYVKIDEELFGVGTGRTKKVAEQNAAKNAITMLEI